MPNSAPQAQYTIVCRATYTLIYCVLCGGPRWALGQPPEGGPPGALFGTMFHYLALFFDFWRDFVHYLALCFTISRYF